MADLALPADNATGWGNTVRQALTLVNKHENTGVAGVIVITGSELRPVANVVFWVGGSEKPANMTTTDVWFSAEAAAEPPTGSAQHSVYGGGAHPTYTANNDGGTIRVANAFYSYTGTLVQRVVGVRIFKSGIFGTAGTAFVSLPEAGVPPVLTAPTQAKAFTGLVDGWNDILFTTPVPLPVATPVWVGYEMTDGSYMHVAAPTGISNVGALAADGSKLAMLDSTDIFNGGTITRGYFSVNGGATVSGAGAGYGIDIIVDEGP